MSFSYDSTGINPDQEYPLLPEGKWFPFRIYEAEEQVTKKNGYPMILAKCEPFNVPEYEGMTVWHRVTFIPKGKPGDGMNVHFRKCIGVPFEGSADVSADDWVGKKFMGKIGHKEYLSKKNHEIVEVSPIKDDALLQEPAKAANKDDDIPF